MGSNLAVGLTRPGNLSNPDAPGHVLGNRKNGQVMTVAETKREAGQDFIRDIVRADLASGRHKTVVTRFPPEPNG